MKVDVSVIITCYRKEQFLDECVASVMQQTKLPKEIIIVHDGCEAPMSHKEAKTLILGKNVGVSEARRLGVHNSTGSLLLFLDADDAIPPEYLEKMVIAISKGADIAYPDFLLWYKGSEYKEQNALHPTPKTLTANLMWKMCRIPVTSLMKREVFEFLGGFEKLKVFEDWLFWLKALARGYKFKHVNTLLYYRQSAGSRNRQHTQVKRDAMRLILDRFSFEGGKLCERFTQS